MNLEKLKEFFVEKKNYFIVAVAIVIGVLWLKNGDGENKSLDSTNQISQINSASAENKSASSVNTSTASPSSPKTVTCDITGAVKHQGVYTLKNGARLQELIEVAGGVTKKAELKAINRAILLKDQDKIHIPYKGEKTEIMPSSSANSTAESSSSTSSDSSQEKVNINTADKAGLQKLTGIGEKKAEQIIAYREQNGSFKKVEDLMQVSGIGEKTFASLKDQLTV